MNKRIKKVVFKILEEDEYARENDNYLIFRAVQELEPHTTGSTFVKIVNSKISMESITRKRREFFKENPNLNPKNIAKIREVERQNYQNEYAH